MFLHDMDCFNVQVFVVDVRKGKGFHTSKENLCNGLFVLTPLDHIRWDMVISITKRY